MSCATRPAIPEPGVRDASDPVVFTATLEGYASIFNLPDENGDIVARGAFAASLQAARRARPVRMLYQHDARTPIGRWTVMHEDARGLFVSGEIILSSEVAREAYALLEGGALDGLSIGFKTVKARTEGAGRRILQADLWEVSVVTFPMAPSARVTRLGAPKPCRPYAFEPEPAGEPGALFADAVRAAADLLSPRAV